MSVLTLSNITHLNKLCKRILSEPGVRFAGVINRMGNRVAGGFREDTEPLVDEHKEHMMYMQLFLELKMRGEFDEELGKLNYLHSKRDKVSMVSIPVDELLILLATEHAVNVERLVDLVRRTYSEFTKTSQKEIVNV